jgi:hypothetical protein
MNSHSRNLPRFLPTLTEVVEPPPVIRTHVAATPDIEDTVWFVMQRVDLVIERRVAEELNAMLRTVVAEHVQTLAASIRQELEVVVREAVTEAMVLQANQHKPK